MSQTVDQRVVEMRFDNKQFESGAKQTMSTLDKLKEALKLPDSAKAFEDLDKASRNVKLDGIASGIEALEKRFSTLGIVSMRVIQNITDGLMNKVHSAVNYVSDAIVSGGIKRAMNIENAHFQLQALLKDETKVQAVMADAMESVDGTAYAYDEAAKAASQFAASGIEAGEDMLNALKGITGVAAMTNSSFEDISRVFTTVAGNGRLMGDQLLQLSSRGLNAASTLADYFREVRGEASITEGDIREFVSKGKISFKDFSDAMTWAFGDSAKRANETFTGSLSNMRSALARIGADFVSPLVEQNGELVKMFNALRVLFNDVRSYTQFDEERSAIEGLTKATKLSKEELTDMFATIKENGHVTSKELKTLTDNNGKAYSTIAKYMNGVADGSIRATYAITTAVNGFVEEAENSQNKMKKILKNGKGDIVAFADDLSEDMKITQADVARLVEEGKIDLATFTAAMEHEFGTEKTIAKQFKDWFLDFVQGITTAIESIDMAKPMEVFYHFVESGKNVAKGFMSVIRPIGRAFGEAFSSFNIDVVNNFASSVENLTAKLKLSEKGSKNVHDAFKGVFDVGKLLIDIFVKLVSAIVPINKPITEMGDGFLGLIGYAGRLLTSFTEIIRSSTFLRTAFDKVQSGFSTVFGGLGKLIKKGKEFISTLSKMEGTTKLIDSVTGAFKKLWSKGLPYVENFMDEVGKFIGSMFSFEDLNMGNVINSISNAFADLSWEIDHFSFETVTKAFDALKDKIKSFGDINISNKGLASFIQNMKQYGEELKEAFTLDNLLDRVEKVMDVFKKFFNWIKETFAPAFEDFSVGGMLGVTGGLGVVYALVKGLKVFEKLSEPLSKISGILGSLQGTLVAYQKNLKADMLLKIAGAIGILAVAITVLSFADMERAWQAAIMLGMIGVGLVVAVGYFTDVVKKTKTINDAAYQLAKAANNFTKALKWKAIGSAFLKIAESIALIGLTIIGLGLMYQKDPEAMEMGAKFVAGIGIALTAIMGLGAIAGKFMGEGMKNFSGLLKSVTSLTVGLFIVVAALNKLFKMTLPDDWVVKAGILGGAMLALGILAILLGVAGRIAGGGSASEISGYKSPLMTELKSVIKQSNGGAISAAPILALAASLYVTVAALNKLFKMTLPDDWETKAKIMVGVFVGIGALMIALGYASKLAGGAIKAATTILSIAGLLVVVVGALAILSIFPAQKILAGSVALGLILLALGGGIGLAAKATGKDTWKTVLAMAIAVGTITAALSILSMVPFPKLAKATVAFAAILGSLAATFNYASKVSDSNSVFAIGLMVAGVVAIAISLQALSSVPWENLLSAAGSLSMVLLAMTASFSLLAVSKPDLNSMAIFAEGVASVLLIGYALYKLAEQPYESVLAAALALTEVLLAMSVAMTTATLVGNFATAAIAGIGVLDLFIANMLLVLAGLGLLIQNPDIAALMNGGMDMLVKLGMSIGEFVGAIVAGALTQMSSALPQIGLNLSEFMVNLTPFAEGAKMFGDDVLKGIGILAASVIALTVSEFVGGIASLFGLSLVAVAVELSAFMTALQPFIKQVKNIDEGSMKACSYLADMVLKLTASEMITGISNLLGFGGSLADFAEELKAFGPAISDFAEEVKDVKPEAVQGAASAASIMAEVASKLQGHGGLWQDIVGDRSLESFAEELKAFGPAISDFAEEVKDVKPEAVQGAASAASIMAEVANNLPEGESLKSKIFGTSVSLSEFGEELTSFAEAIVPFCTKVKDVNPDSISSVSTVTTIMTNLANNLPNSDTLWNKMFGGGQKTLSEFGEELVKFGSSMSEFSGSLNGFDSEKVNGAIESFKAVIDLSNYVQGASSDSLADFSKSLSKVAVDAIDNFVQAFADSEPKVTGAISSLGNSMTNSLKNYLPNTEFSQAGQNVVQGIISGIIIKMPLGLSTVKNFCISIINQFRVSLPQMTFSTIGQNVVQGFVNGINSRKSLAISTVSGLCSAIVNEFKAGLQMNTFKILGENVVTWIIQGMDAKKAGIQSSIANTCNTIVNTFKENLKSSTFEEIGGNAALGMKQGIESKSSDVSKAASQAAQNAVSSAKKALDVHSPSKVMTKVGGFFSLGLANGIIEKIRAISLAGTKAADEAITPVKHVIDGISSMIDSGDFDIDPVITPVVDLTEVQDAAREIGSLMNRTYDLSSVYNNVMDASSSFNRNKKFSNDVDTPAQTTGGGNKYEFIQNNYSPKALSRSEIYRQTNNQFSAFRKAVNPS